MKPNDIIRNRIRERFFQVYNSGASITMFANIPKEMLDKDIQDILDSSLYEEGFIALKQNETLSFKDIVLLRMFDDSPEVASIEVKISIRTKFLEFLNNMNAYFEAQEDYEKCSYLQKRKQFYSI